MKAYILMKFKPGADLAQATHALKEPGVERIDMIMGIYDAIVTVHADNLETLGKLATQVRNCPAIQDSVTCPVIS